MGLTADITEAIQEAFDGDLFDATKTITVSSVTSVYDTSTGVTTDTTLSEDVRAVVQTVDKNMVDGEVILLDDTQFLILVAELSSTPIVGGIITVGNIDYSINSVTKDPADVAWTLVGRAT